MDELEYYFVTDTDRHQVTMPQVGKGSARRVIRALARTTGLLTLDFETTGLDPYLSALLLTSIRVGNQVFVIDNTTIPLVDILDQDCLIGTTVLAHNAKFEYKFAKVNGITLHKMYCTMVAEQRLTQGSGLSCSIVNTLLRRKLELPSGMNKEVREKFIGADPTTVVWTDDEIWYSAGDVVPLEELKEKQDRLISLFNLEHLIYNIEMPLVGVLAECELTGFKHDSLAWIAYAKSKQAEAEEIVEQLNNILISVHKVDVTKINPVLAKGIESREKKLVRLKERADKLEAKIQDLEAREKQHTKAYSVTKETWEKVCDELATLPYEEVPTEELGINWGSADQVLNAFKEIKGFPIPLDKNKTTKKMEPSVSKEARSMWFADNGDSKHIALFKLFDKYKKLIHNVNAFGEKWVTDYINPKTGRVHTYFWQCNTDTGRLACGDAKSGWPNLQQIPAIKELRSCFVADEGYEIVTCDLSGAELTIMCSLADDTELWALGEADDIHSPIATAAWRRVYQSRGDKDNANNFLITKEVNADLRRKFKNLTFGSIYGCHASKAATTVGVNKKEGQIILDGIRDSIPKTFAMVEAATEQAWNQGYLVSDTRSNSRKWFKPVIDRLRVGMNVDEIKEDLSFMDRVAIDGQSRNYKIQSTQASMIKEAMVFIDKFNKKYNLDVTLKGSVHDELIYQYPIGLKVDYGVEMPYAEFVAQAMIGVANLYLKEPYLMKADYHTAKHWLK